MQPHFCYQYRGKIWKIPVLYMHCIAAEIAILLHFRSVIELYLTHHLVRMIQERAVADLWVGSCGPASSYLLGEKRRNNSRKKSRQGKQNNLSPPLA